MSLFLNLCSLLRALRQVLEEYWWSTLRFENSQKVTKHCGFIPCFCRLAHVQMTSCAGRRVLQHNECLSPVFLYQSESATFREEQKGFRKRAVLANVPSFRVLVPGNIRMYPRSSFWYWGTSECTLVPGFGTGEHPPKPPFWKPPFCEPPKMRRRRRHDHYGGRLVNLVIKNLCSTELT